MALIGLADCNSFYASCERVFRPDLVGRPIVVLSNNDGCIVALSKEAKAVGITRGIPYFKAKDIIKRYGVSVFSSNYTLYQDLSDRVMSMIGLLTDGIEVYSIDECFFHKEDMADPEGFASRLSLYLKRGIGLPVSVAVARTKTLAKIANHIAKKGKGSMFLGSDMEETVLKETPVDDVWGIGWRTGPRCISMGIRTAWDFANLDDEFLLKNFTVTGYNTARELRGIATIGPEKPADLSVSSSISFASPQSDYEEIKKAVACHCSTVCDKLVKSGSYASSIALQLITNRFEPGAKNDGGAGELEFPSNYVPDVVECANRILDLIFRPDGNYRSVRVIAWNLKKKDQIQMPLFDYENKTRELDRKNAISAIVKNCNIRCATTGFTLKKDLAKCSMRSPLYTTQWTELPQVGRSDSLYLSKAPSKNQHCTCHS